MLNIRIYKAFALAAILSLLSCNKWLDLKPQDGVVRQDYWKNQDQIEAAVNGCYYSLANSELIQNLFVWGELRADMVAITPFSNVQEQDISIANILSTNTYSKWGTVYSVINNCNTVIDYAPEVLNHDQTLKANPEKLDNYLAEARGLRALMYFYLLRVFGEVPLQLKAVSSDKKIELLPKSTKEEVFKQIIDDLAFAESKSATLTFNAVRDKGRLNRYSINAIQADVYLWMADKSHPEYYDECLKACDKVINSGNYGLIDGKDQTDWYTKLFFDGNSNEGIFEVQFDSQLLNPFYDMFVNTRRRFAINPDAPERFFGIDMENPLNKDIRADGGSFRSSDFMIWKFGGTPNIILPRTQNQSHAHWFMYRYADILLLKAEALAWTGQGAAAIALVDNIRARARALQQTAENPELDNPTAISDYIVNERAREFAFEGKRWFDVLRNAKRDNYAHLDLMISIIAENAPASVQQIMVGKYSDVRSHYMPIHIDELQADKNLIQNPYYQ